VRHLAEATDVKVDVNWRNPLGNCALGEAANGAQVEVLEYLLSRRAAVDNRGEFERTPLYRAAYIGCAGGVEVLLEAGADKWAFDVNGACCLDVARDAEVRKILEDFSEEESARARATLAAVEAKLQRDRKHQRRHEEENQQATVSHCEDATRTAQGELLEAYKGWMSVLSKAPKDRASEEGLAWRGHLTKAEAGVVHAKGQVSTRAKALIDARRMLREIQAGEDESDCEDDTADVDLPGCFAVMWVPFRALNDVVFKDVHDRLLASGRWPLVIDPSGRASVFFQYSGAHYLRALSVVDMEARNLRAHLLSALKIGVPLVVDFLDLSVGLGALEVLFDRVEPGLLARVLNRSFLKDKAFLSLVDSKSEAERKMFAPFQFTDQTIAAFRFVVCTAAELPAADLLASMYVLQVRLDPF